MLLSGGNIMIITTQQLKEHYKNLSDPVGRISRDIKNEKLFPLVKGLYETDPNADGSKLAQAIYGPSYLSFDYILYYQGLIPEAVYNTFTCATYNKRKIKKYSNRYGTFIYRDVPKAVFSLGVCFLKDNGYSYQVATAEKAFCDKLYTLSPVKNLNDFKALLFDDLRINEENLKKLNLSDIIKLAPLYHCKNLYFLERMLKGE